MEDIYFSARELGFFIGSWRDEGIYTDDNWPDDAVLLTAEEVNEYHAKGSPTGKILGSTDGRPAWVDVPPPSHEEQIAAAECQKQALRVAADAQINWRQDAVEAGIATAEETAALSEWTKYRIQLMRVDTSKPDWPTPPGEQAS
ncbi:tail fiber assembly protein [Citrobacter europaeus]|uniref:tail fiber assembly protein n=1 Tax=Citrobacter europaeus TaxID=1914243 RepID=UPI00397BEC35